MTNTTDITISDITKLQIVGEEWYDKRYGNSYCATRVYGLVNDEWVDILATPFDNRYGDGYIDAATEALEAAGFFSESDYYNRFTANTLPGAPSRVAVTRGRLFDLKPLRRLMHDRNMPLEASISTTATKRDVITWGTL